MKKSYLLVYSDITGTREHIVGVLNNMPMIDTWRYDMPNCFYVVSEESADELTDEFRRVNNNNNGRFIFMEYTDNSQGWLPEKTWFLLNNKYHMRESE